MTRPFATAVLLTFMLVACRPASPEVEVTPTPSPSPSPSPSPVVTGYREVVLAENLGLPVAINFAPDGRIFFAQVKEGAIRVLDATGALNPTPVAVFEVSKIGEFGLLGLALDPEFAANHRMYAYYTEPDADGTAKGNKVVRLVESNNQATVEATIIDDIPPSRDKHAGGRLTFGPDGMLYVAVGDTQRPDQAQDAASPVGKILRVNTDGVAPADNPFPGSRAWALGLRNPFGLSFDPDNGRLFVAENGPNSFDEVNVAEKPGENFGHPVVFGPSGGRFKDPIWNSGPESHGMSGVAAVRNSLVPQLDERVFFCTFNTGVLHSLPILPDGGFGAEEALPHFCNLDVAVSPEGIVHIANGSIVKLEPVTGSQP